MCDEAVTFRRSIASSAMFSAVSTPIVISDAGQVVVDRRSDADDLEAHLRQRQRAGLRAVAADDDQAVDPAGAQVARGRARGPRLVLELGQPRAAQEGPAPLQDAAHVAGAERRQSALRPGRRSRCARRKPPSPCRCRCARRRGWRRSFRAHRRRWSAPRSSSSPCAAQAITWRHARQEGGHRQSAADRDQLHHAGRVQAAGGRVDFPAHQEAPRGRRRALRRGRRRRSLRERRVHLPQTPAAPDRQPAALPVEAARRRADRQSRATRPAATACSSARP